ncbi:MAG TPA: GHMP kinase [Actinomycetes bacterium]|nr:GHMP kinase [Actinomycetes bacterium]
MGREPILRARAPLRISFAGGGTDVPPFPADEGGAVLSATINRYAFASLVPRCDRQVSVRSLDYGLSVEFGVDERPAFDGDLDLAKAAVHRLIDRELDGFDLFLHSSAPPGSGLGASSAMVVALVAVLQERCRLGLTDYVLAEVAHDVERTDLGIRGGRQDHYSATFGGFNFIEFGADRVVVNPLRVKPEVVNELEHNLLLVYTGRTRLSDHIIDDQVRRYSAGDSEAVKGLQQQKELARQMKDALLRGRHDDFGHLLDEAWQAKRRLSPRIATPFIDEVYERAVRAGALGGKVTGAGGGGYMVFYCAFDRRHLVAEDLLGLGLSVGEITFEPLGLTTWRVDG